MPAARDVRTILAILSQPSLEPPDRLENMSCKFFTPRRLFDRGGGGGGESPCGSSGSVAIVRKIVQKVLSFRSVLREGGCRGMHGRHTPPAPPRVDLAPSWAPRREMTPPPFSLSQGHEGDVMGGQDTLKRGWWARRGP